jgi:hypothetical protein
MLIVFFVLCGVTYGKEIKSRYTTISYDNQKHLQTFNNRLNMGRLRYLLRGKNSLTVEDEVKHKIDVITQSVCDILEMHPPGLQYGITLVLDKNGVKKIFIKLHGKIWENTGFYHAPNNTVYLSIEDTKLSLLAHEVGHVVVNNYFEVSPPVKIHELLAQFAEKHITD